MFQKSFTFSGLMAPVFTPFTNDGKFQLKLDVIPMYAKHLKDSGINGILVNGTTGEGCSQSLAERRAVAEAWASVKQEFGLTVVVQVGGAPLPDVLDLAKHAEGLGVDGIMCLHDLFYRPANVDQLVDYLSLVGAAAPNTPLLYYHLPGFTGINLSSSSLLEKCSGRVPNFVGLKFTSSDLQELAKCIEICRTNKFLHVYLGCDDLLLPAHSLGSQDAIGTTFNLIPGLALQLMNHVNSGKNAGEATEIQRKISRIVNSITRGGPWVSTMKAAMSALTPIQVGPPRPPLKSVSEEHNKAMITELKQLLA